MNGAGALTAICLVALVATWAGCGGMTSGGSDSESHFVGCSERTDCASLGAGYACSGGRCVRETAEETSSGGSPVPAIAPVESPPASCPVDDSDAFLPGEPVSLRRDILPLFGLSCTQSQCHDRRSSAAGLYLGPRCQFQDGACLFDPPLDDAVVDEVLAELLAPSTTAPALARVAPGRPAESFLMHKLAGCQNQLGLSCTPQHPTTLGCGDEMPPGQALRDQRNGIARYDAVARWIAAGAPYD